jgi:hypothetical protein
MALFYLCFQQGLMPETTTTVSLPSKVMYVSPCLCARFASLTTYFLSISCSGSWGVKERRKRIIERSLADGKVVREDVSDDEEEELKKKTKKTGTITKESQWEEDWNSFVLFSRENGTSVLATHTQFLEVFAIFLLLVSKFVSTLFVCVCILHRFARLMMTLSAFSPLVPPSLRATSSLIGLCSICYA